MVRERVVRKMVDSAIQAMGVAASDCSAQELLSASFTLLNNLMDVIIEQSPNGLLEQNKSAMAIELGKLFDKVQPAGLAN